MSTSVANEGLDQENDRFSYERLVLKNAGEVPSLPNTAYQLLMMSINDRVNARDVINLIKLEPNLTARLIRYAKSAYFGYRGELESIEQAVVSVLGLRLTVNIAIGITLGNQFCKSNAGPMGLHDFWRHSINHALLMQGLSSRIPNQFGVNPELAYLCGLLHDFGVLLIGQINRRQSILLNEMIKANPETSRVELENQILGFTHTNIGACLLQEWQLPQAVVEVAASHHNLMYQGKFAPYVKLAGFGNFVLENFLIGKKQPSFEELPDTIRQLLQEFELSFQDILDLCTRLEVMENELNSLADVLIG